MILFSPDYPSFYGGVGVAGRVGGASGVLVGAGIGVFVGGLGVLVGAGLGVFVGGFGVLVGCLRVLVGIDWSVLVGRKIVLSVVVGVAVVVTVAVGGKEDVVGVTVEMSINAASEVRVKVAGASVGVVLDVAEGMRVSAATVWVACREFCHWRMAGTPNPISKAKTATNTTPPASQGVIRRNQSMVLCLALA